MQPLAIVGIGALFPQAANLEEYWANIKEAVDAIADVPASHWDPAEYFDADPKRPDFTYARRGGFLDPIEFDPLKYGIPPNVLEATDTSQLLGMKVAADALEDAGYGMDREFDRDRVSVILGVTGTLELVIPLGARLGHPKWRRAMRDAGVPEEQLEDAVRRIADAYVEWQEGSFPGLLGNVVAGRISKFLNLGGTNCVVDAACASALGAVHLAAMELQNGKADMALTGGVDTFNDIFMYMCFSKTPALSPSGDARPFDAQGDGTILGEGVGLVVLKRLADAERDGNKIYAVLKGIGSSSDGRGDAIYAPSARGQQKALRRAYAAAGISPATIELVEAHGTGTKVGDAVEVNALNAVFGTDQSEIRSSKFETNSNIEIQKKDETSSKSQISNPNSQTNFKFQFSNDVEANAADDGEVCNSPQTPDPRPQTLHFEPGIRDPEPETRYPVPQIRPWCALGSVKSQIGHTKAAAGAASLIKAALALYHKTLPPTIKVRQPLEALNAKDSPFYLNTLKRPWPGRAGQPRRAALSSFGFGGSNFHCVLEEHGGTKTRPDWSGRVQLFAYSGTSRAELRAKLDALEAGLDWAELRVRAAQSRAAFDAGARCRLALVLERGRSDLAQSIASALRLLDGTDKDTSDRKDKKDICEGGEYFAVSPEGVYFGEGAAAGRLGIIFSGQGSQYCGMLRDLACQFPELLEALEQGNRWFAIDGSEGTNGTEGTEGTNDTTEIVAGGTAEQRDVAVERDIAAEQRDNTVGERDVTAGRGDIAAGQWDVAAGRARLSDLIYPLPAFDAEREQANEAALRDTRAAQPAIGAVSLGAWRVLRRFGVSAQAFCGHSFGELSALCAAGRLSAEDFFRLACLRGRLMGEGAGDRGAMLAVLESAQRLREILAEEKIGLTLANINAPKQTVLSGSTAEIEQAEAILKRRKIRATRLPVSGAFHSPLLAGALEPFGAALQQIEFAPGSAPVFANSTARPYPDDAAGCRELLAGQLALPVEFVELIRNMRAAGVSTFLEIGPGGKIGRLAEAILEGAGAVAAALDAPNGRPAGITGLAAVLALLAARGHACDLAQWDEDFARAEKAPRESKPRLTIPICGANYVSPKKLRPAARRAVQLPNPADGVNTIDPAAAASAAGAAGAPRPAIAGDGSYQELLRQTQESIFALQQAQRHTAQLHQQFLQNQQNFVQAFQQLLEQRRRIFSGEAAPAGAPAAAESNAVTQPAAQPTAAPAAQTVREPRQAPAVSAIAPAMPNQTATPGMAAKAGSTIAGDGLQTLLFQVLEEKTGYPTDALDLEMQLDADLGIDSIKRVEILSALQERLPDAPAVQPEQLAAIRTLRDILNVLGERLVAEAGGGQPVSGATTPASAPPAAGGRAAAPHGPMPADDAAIGAMLKDVVAEKTGYPAEMLELSMTLDGDLGIDSIKRVEILSALQDRLPEARPAQPEELGGLRTLHDIVQLLARKTAAAPAMQTGGAAATAADQPVALNRDPQPAECSVQRLVVYPRPFGAEEQRPVDFPAAGLIWIAGGDEQLAAALIRAYAEKGARAERVELESFEARPAPENLAGLVLVSSLPRTDEHFLKRCLSLLKHVHARLLQNARRWPVLLISVSRLDGAFGLISGNGRSEPVSAGLAGLVKTAQHEWPQVRCKALDLSPDFADCAAAAAAVVEESLLGGLREVGIGETRRHAVDLRHQAAGRAGAPPFEPGDLIVITGGGRGVTAAVALELARAFRPTLAIFGRSPQPQAEPDWLAGLEDESGIKRLLHERSGGRLGPRELGEQCRALLAGRELRRNLEQLRSAGAEVSYHAVDIRDRAAVDAAIAQLRGSFGAVRGLVHGAGVLADRLIADKTEEQFDLVYSVKVGGLQNLLAALADDPLRVIGLFSSSTGRFGRKGQSDYAAANEVLNKIAQYQAALRPDCRVVSINWGPWNGGMVTPELARLFRSEGIALIEPRAGAEYFIEEISLPPQGSPVEVVIFGAGAPLMRNMKLEHTAAGGCVTSFVEHTAEGGCATSFPEPTAAGGCATSFVEHTAEGGRATSFLEHTAEGGYATSLLEHTATGGRTAALQPQQAARAKAAGLAPALRLELNCADYPALRSHVLGGRAVLPVALILEWLGHAALHRNPGLHFSGVDALRVLQGVKLAADETRTLELCCGKPVKAEAGFAVAVELRGEHGGRPLIHADATVLLSTGGSAEEVARLPIAAGRHFDLSALYPANGAAGLLFHGPHFQGVQAVEDCTADFVQGLVDRAPAPQSWFAKPPRARWIGDPLAVDCAFQLLIYWAHANRLPLNLPVALQRYRQYTREFPGGLLRVAARVNQHTKHRCWSDVEWTHAESGRLLARLEGYECVMDESLTAAFGNHRLPEASTVS